MQAKFQVMNCAKYQKLNVGFEIYSLSCYGRLDSRTVGKDVISKEHVL